MNKEKMAEMGIVPFETRTSGYRIHYSRLIDECEGVLGMRIEDAVKDPLGDRFQDNMRMFWSRHIDGEASSCGEESICFAHKTEDWMSCFQDHFGADWAYVPAKDLSPEQVKTLKDDDLWGRYLYYPVFQAIVEALDEVFGKGEDTTVVVSYNW